MSESDSIVDIIRKFRKIPSLESVFKSPRVFIYVYTINTSDIFSNSSFDVTNRARPRLPYPTSISQITIDSSGSKIFLFNQTQKFFLQNYSTGSILLIS